MKKIVHIFVSTKEREKRINLSTKCERTSRITAAITPSISSFT